MFHKESLLVSSSLIAPEGATGGLTHDFLQRLPVPERTTSHDSRRKR
jgi:hypothetical protein